MNPTSIKKFFMITLIMTLAMAFSTTAGASERRNFNAEQHAAVMAAINLIEQVGFTAHAQNLRQMLDNDITRADGSTSGLKQIHMDTDPSYTPKGTTTAYQGSGGNVTGAIRLNDDLVKSGSQMELAATLVHERPM